MKAERSPTKPRPVGRPPGNGPTVRLLVRVPRKLYDRITKAAVADDRSRDAFLSRLIDEALSARS